MSSLKTSEQICVTAVGIQKTFFDNFWAEMLSFKNG
jgi:hypothetical protein